MVVGSARLSDCAVLHLRWDDFQPRSSLSFLPPTTQLLGSGTCLPTSRFWEIQTQFSQLLLQDGAVIDLGFTLVLRQRGLKKRFHLLDGREEYPPPLAALRIGVSNLHAATARPETAQPRRWYLVGAATVKHAEECGGVLSFLGLLFGMSSPDRVSPTYPQSAMSYPLSQFTSGNS